MRKWELAVLDVLIWVVIISVQCHWAVHLRFMHSRYVTISKKKNVRKEKRKRMGGDEWEMARKDSLVKSFTITGSKEMGQWLEAV